MWFVHSLGDEQLASSLRSLGSELLVLQIVYLLLGSGGPTNPGGQSDRQSNIRGNGHQILVWEYLGICLHQVALKIETRHETR